MRDRKLRRFWFEFEIPPLEQPCRGISLDGGTWTDSFLGKGCGVTGYDEQDCLDQLRQLLGGDPLPPVRTVIPDVDLSRLDIGDHKRGVPVWRSVWFPAQPYSTDP